MESRLYYLVEKLKIPSKLLSYYNKCFLLYAALSDYPYINYWLFSYHKIAIVFSIQQILFKTFTLFQGNYNNVALNDQFMNVDV